MKHTLIASAIATGIALASLIPSARAEEPELRHVRLCDASVCYHAWNVVDTDGDGVSDADEVMAGTDPHDPASRPSLPLIVEMIGAQLMPTFEFGVGQIVVRPAELQAKLEAYGGGAENPLAAFPLGDRKDAFSRLGLDTDLLAEHGYDAERDGLTLVRGHDDKGAPVRRVGGVDVRLISAGDDAGDTKIPDDLKVVFKEETKDGRTVILYSDGSSLEIKNGKGDYRGPDGKPVKGGYYNPDADTGTGEPTEEQKQAWERVRNATVRTIAGWEPIQGDPGQLPDRRKTIILVDPEHQEFEGDVSEPPQIDRAQPDIRPDLPNPLLEGGGCFPKCRI